MARHDRSDDEGDLDRRTVGDPDVRRDSTGEWLAASTLRVVLAVVGLVVLLFGLSMAIGVDLLGILVDALATPLVQWLLLALVGLVILVVAVRGFGTYSRE